MIRKLTENDVTLYVDHMHRVYNEKGWLSIKNEEWVSSIKRKEIENFDFAGLFKEPWLHVWAKFDEQGNIIQSIRTHHLTTTPRALIVNYKSELQGLFNPVKDMLPILDQVMQYFENIGVYNFHVVRKVGFFEWRKNKFFEDMPPLNRYNCYIDEVVPANNISTNSGHQKLAFDTIFPVDTGIVCMSLKQELRRYQGKSIIPDTKEMFIKMQNKKNVCIIGHNPESNKISNALLSNLIDHNVTTIGRNNFNFSDPNWKELLLTELDNLSSPLTIIINLFDYTQMSLQQQIFDELWKKYESNPKIHIVVLGSMVHYYANNINLISEDYFNAKKTLNQSCIHRGMHTYFKCKLLLIEPGTVESYITNNSPEWASMYLTDDEFAKKMLALMEINSKFLYVTLNGSHVYLPPNSESI